LKLQEKGEINLIYTLDGKEFLTHEHLDMEIKREIHHHGGRLELLELQTLLSVDVGLIELKIRHLTTTHHNYNTVAGEVITKDYLDGIVNEINSLLQEQGKVSLGDLVTRFRLPPQFLNDKILQPHLGTTINGVIEEGNLYTDGLLTQYKKQIRGILAAVLDPIPLSSIQHKSSFIPNLFYRCTQELVDGGEIPGELHGSGANAVYVPAIYAESRANHIKQFMACNNIIEYSMLSKLRITNQNDYLTNKLGIPGKGLLHYFVTQSFLEDIDAHVASVVSEKSWINIQVSPITFSGCLITSVIGSDTRTNPSGRSERTSSTLSFFPGIY